MDDFGGRCGARYSLMREVRDALVSKCLITQLLYFLTLKNIFKLETLITDLLFSTKCIGQLKW